MLSSSYTSRNKCIKLADKYPAGWDTVKEYLSDGLASESEDEKRIRSAEGRAIRARNQRKRFNRKRDYRPSNRDDVRPAASATATAPVSAEPLFRGPGDHRESPSRPTHATPAMRRGTGERTARRPSRASDHDNDKYLCTLQSSSMLIEHSEPDVLCSMTVDHSDLTSEQNFIMHVAFII